MQPTIWWLMLGLVVISVHTVQNQIMQSSLTLQAYGTDFIPANPIELITTYTDISSFLSCYIICNMNPLCRTFVSDIGTPSVCRLYEGLIDTGTIVDSSSLTSCVAGLHYEPSFYLAYNQICDPHIVPLNRYLICINNFWKCPTATFWNGSMCLNQVYYGDSCTVNEGCRQDVGLQCSASCQKCFDNTTASWNNISCVIHQTSYPSSNPPNSSVLSYWSLNGNANDLTNTNNGTLSGNASFGIGYIGQGIQCSGTSNINMPYIDFYRRSFTIEFWFYIFNTTDFRIGLVGECMNQTTSQCLHLGIDNNTLYMAFYNNDLQGSTIVVHRQWHHVAFVYDSAAQNRRIYLNGLLDNSTSVKSRNVTDYLGQSGYVTICNAAPWVMPWNGYIDQVSVTNNRAKTADEILNDATLIAYYSFDNGSLLDAGPNFLQSIAVGQTVVSGRVNDALLFNSTNAYFQTSSFITFGIINQSFSIALWIKPLNLHGILVHISNQSTTDGWCVPLLGFNSSGILIAQVTSSIIGVPAIPLNVWTHIAQTFSVQNGLQLYINGTLRQTVLGASTNPPYQSMYLTMANQQTGGSSCMWGAIDPGSYAGAVDELRIYNREVNATEIVGMSS